MDDDAAERILSTMGAQMMHTSRWSLDMHPVHICAGRHHHDDTKRHDMRFDEALSSSRY